jgi:hypothetical protein
MTGEIFFENSFMNQEMPRKLLVNGQPNLYNMPLLAQCTNKNLTKTAIDQLMLISDTAEDDIIVNGFTASKRVMIDNALDLKRIPLGSDKREFFVKAILPNSTIGYKSNLFLTIVIGIQEQELVSKIKEANTEYASSIKELRKGHQRNIWLPLVSIGLCVLSSLYSLVSVLTLGSGEAGGK